MKEATMKEPARKPFPVKGRAGKHGVMALMRAKEAKEMPADEAKESAAYQALESRLGVEKHKGGKRK